MKSITRFITDVLMVLLVTFSLSPSSVQSRAHHHHHHNHQDYPPQSTSSNSTYGVSANSSSAPPPKTVDGGNNGDPANSPAYSPAPPPLDSDSSNSTMNSTTISPAPPPETTSSNSTSAPPPPESDSSNSTSGNSTNSTSPPPPPPTNGGSDNDPSNSTAISPPPPPVSANSTNMPPSPPTDSTSLSPPPPPVSSNSTNSTNDIPPPPPLDDRTNGHQSNSNDFFDVRSFGAVGDGVSDDTKAFKSAWDSACQAGHGTILAPRSYSFLIHSTIFAGPCHTGIIFQVEGTIIAPNGPDSWPASYSKRQWLVFYRADGLTMQGGGLIDGRGQKWWNLPCKPHKGPNGSTLAGNCDSPVALRFFQSSNLTVSRIKVVNSPQFHFRFDNCRNVTVDSVSINSPALSPNTDGIHVENSETVGIYNSIISNGDDCVSIGSGALNVHIQNVTCGPSHGISIGSLGKQASRACVKNITVRDSIIKHSDNGVRIKTWQGGSGSVSAIVFNNIHMDTVRNPIIIDQYYCLDKGKCVNSTSAVYVSDVSYLGIKGTYDARSPPVHFGCSDAVPCTNITLSEVELLPAVGVVIEDAFCWNVYGDMRTLTIPPLSCLMEGLPRSIMDIDGDQCY